VTSPALRASFFASAREIQELEIDVLMRLNEPDAALAVVERGRARSLLELLGESGVEIRKGADTALLDREQELVRLISGKAERQTRLLSGKHTEADAAAARKELDCLTADLEQVQSRIRETSPQYAALTQPEPLNLREIQAKVLDQDTILLEYSLGAARSFLWAVTRDSADVFVLPPKAQVESAAKRVYDLLDARNRKSPNEAPAARVARLRQADETYPAAAAKAGRILLGPVATRLKGKRLLIVADGVLQYLPFAALPEPAGQSPLIVNHEIAMAPSASVVAVMRRETAGRPRAAKTLAVVADPVFSTDDARIAQPTRGGTAATQNFVRLRFSRREAEDIAGFLPKAATFQALDFNASRETVLSPDFGRHRIVHFATHSVLNNERPELSGVVLSLVDRSGRPRDGFLRLYDIYNLRLAADLVVLSACQTALGGEIHGEGLIGLTRGFLYAGAARVVASLWEVDDRTSAELMKRFYAAMLLDGQRPAAALRTAQVAMWSKKGWEAPYYWAAYTLQGEWR
jgi:CHAT domain-containing protein